jgi:hypothetical protein
MIRIKFTDKLNAGETTTHDNDVFHLERIIDGTKLTMIQLWMPD